MPNAPPLLSVIVPVFNAAPFLDDFFASLAAQSCRDFELIVVDDGSDDQSAAIAGTWLDRLPGAQLLRQPRQGPYAARNRGLSLARGRWVAFADADDVLERDLYARLMAEAGDAEVVACNGAFWHPDRGTQTTMLGLPGGRRRGADFLVEQVHAGGLCGNEWLYCVRRDLVERHRLRHIEAPAKVDVAWTAELLLAAGRLLFVAEPLYRYRQHPRSLSRDRVDAARANAVLGHLANTTALGGLWQRLHDGEAAARAAISRLIQEEGHRLGHELRSIGDPALRRILRAALGEAGLAPLLWRHASTFRERRRAVRRWVETALLGRV